MKTTKISLALALTISLGVVSVLADDDDAKTPKLPPASTKTGVTFATDIKPIFDASCVKCHNSAGPKPPRAGLALDSLAGTLKGSKDGPVVTVGHSDHSDLVMSVAHVGDDSDQFMPKGKGAKKLSDEQIGLIRAWIDQGAK